MWAEIGAVALGTVLALWWLRRRYDSFREWATARLSAAYPDMVVERIDPTALVGSLAGTSVRVDLPSLFRRLRGRADPAARGQGGEAVRAALPTPEPPPFGRVRGALLPLLKGPEFVDTLGRYPPPLRLLALPFGEGLSVVYALQGFHQITYVTAGMLESWGIGPDELHALALANLRRRTEHLLAELGGARRAYEHLDGFEAARILIPDLVTPEEIGDPLLAIPDEHILLIEDSARAEDLAAAASRAFAAARRPLSPRIFRLREPSLRPEVVS